MKMWRRFQRCIIAVSMIYGLWLGSNVDATDKDSSNAFIIVTLSATIAIGMYTPTKEQEKNS